jgi:hypothetical protein
MKKFFRIIFSIILATSVQAQNKKFRTDSLKVMNYLDARGRAIVRDSLNVTNNIHANKIYANKLYGDGSNLTSVMGSVGESNGDLTIGADKDANDSGQMSFTTRNLLRGRFLNDGRFLLGFPSTNISGTAIFSNTISVAQDDSNGYLVGLSAAGGTANLFSGKNGTGSFAPLAFWTSGTERGRFSEDGQYLIGFTSSNAGGAIVANDAITSAESDSNGSLISMNIGGGVANIVSGRNGTGSYLPLRFYLNGSEKIRFALDGSIGIRSQPGTSTVLDLSAVSDGALRIPNMTHTQRAALSAAGGMAIYSTSMGKWYFRQGTSWDSLLVAADIATMNAAGWTDLGTRIQPQTLSDTMRVNNLRIGTSSTSGHVLTMDANGNATPQAPVSSAFNPSTTYEFFEEFAGGNGVSSNGIGQENWTGNFVNSATGGVTVYDDVNTPGVGYINALAANREATIYNNLYKRLVPGDFFQMRILIGSVSASEDLRSNFGFSEQTTYSNWLSTGNGAFFNFNPDSSANWRLYCINNGSVTKLTTSMAPLAGTWYILKGTVNASLDSMVFRINGTIVGTVAGPPNGSGRYTKIAFCCQSGAGAGGNNFVRVDYAWVKGTLSR